MAMIISHRWSLGLDGFLDVKHLDRIVAHSKCPITATINMTMCIVDQQAPARMGEGHAHKRKLDVNFALSCLYLRPGWDGFFK